MWSMIYLRLAILMSMIVFSSSVSGDESISEREYDCVIIPSNVADLGSNARGIIDRVLVDRNDFVKRGDAIAVLDDTVETAVFELARKQASLTSEIELRKAYMEHTEKELQRAEKAYTGQAYSQQAVDLARMEAQQAKIKLLQAKENQNLSRKELERAKASLARRTIRAPFSGVVMERFKAAGEFVESEPVIRLARLDPLHVEVIVPSSEQGKVKAGMRGKVGLGDKRWDATVSQVDRVMDAASGTFGVRLNLPNPEYKITAGVRCRLKFYASAELMPVIEILKPKQMMEEPSVMSAAKPGIVITTKPSGAPATQLTPVVREISDEKGCERLGPYKDQKDAESVIVSLKLKGQNATSKKTTWMQPVGYRVVSTILRTPDEKDVFIAALKKASVKEYFALHQADGIERISMGAFSKEEAASRYQKTLAKKGLVTEVAPWKKEVSSYWVKTGCESE